MSITEQSAKHFDEIFIIQLLIVLHQVCRSDINQIILTNFLRWGYMTEVIFNLSSLELCYHSGEMSDRQLVGSRTELSSQTL